MALDACELLELRLYSLDVSSLKKYSRWYSAREEDGVSVHHHPWPSAQVTQAFFKWRHIVTAQSIPSHFQTALGRGKAARCSPHHAAQPASPVSVHHDAGGAWLSLSGMRTRGRSGGLADKPEKCEHINAGRGCVFPGLGY